MEVSSAVILLAEDDPDDVTLIKRAFRRGNVNATIHVASDGDQVIAYLRGDGEFANRQKYPLPALLLLDLKMPRKSGFEVLEWLRQQPGLRRLPVAVLTGSTEHSDVKQAYDLGANSYLAKPVGLEACMQLICNLNLYWLILNKSPSLT